LGGQEITDELWEELEALLIQADVGVETTIDLVERLQETAQQNSLRTSDQVKDALRQELISILEVDNERLDPKDFLLYVILVVGVNGSGKTTTIGKLAKQYQDQGMKVVLAAADTFRAAAIDQLRIWGDRVGCEVIAHQPGADPGAVVYDAIRASKGRGANVLIVDTAGRLHTKFNLMQELRKLDSIAAKQVHKAPHEVLLVLDATTGQNALVQARHFREASDLTGVMLAKLDGTAKGGMVFAVARELGVPVRYVGVGEGIDDFATFDAETFVSALLED
jgi:fused signal recognition particle receptor